MRYFQLEFITIKKQKKLAAVTPSAKRNTYSVAIIFFLTAPRVEALRPSTLGYVIATPIELPRVRTIHYKHHLDFPQVVGLMMKSLVERFMACPWKRCPQAATPTELPRVRTIHYKLHFNALPKQECVNAEQAQPQHD